MPDSYALHPCLIHFCLQEPYRTSGPAPFAGPYYQRNCYPRQQHADTVVQHRGADITWFVFTNTAAIAPRCTAWPMLHCPMCVAN